MIIYKKSQIIFKKNKKSLCFACGCRLHRLFQKVLNFKMIRNASEFYSVNKIKSICLVEDYEVEPLVSQCH